jgi:cephalosporin hydroxylase
MNPKNIPKIVSAKIKRALKKDKDVVEKFNSHYYYSKVWSDTYWLGKKVFKCPTDLWIYQELLFETKPDVIVECGTFHGGSALYFANLFDAMGTEGGIITIDVDAMPDMPLHKRIKYLYGSSISPEIIDKVKELIKDKQKIMVILDSDHSKEHVTKELGLYHGFVTKGCYLVVEDSNLNGHPVYSGFGHGPGPMEAMEEFLPNHPEFEIDISKEKFFLTFNPKGYLKKIK